MEDQAGVYEANMDDFLPGPAVAVLYGRRGGGNGDSQSAGQGTAKPDWLF